MDGESGGVFFLLSLLSNNSQSPGPIQLALQTMYILAAGSKVLLDFYLIHGVNCQIEFYQSSHLSRGSSHIVFHIVCSLLRPSSSDERHRWDIFSKIHVLIIMQFNGVVCLYNMRSLWFDGTYEVDDRGIL